MIRYDVHILYAEIGDIIFALFDGWYIIDITITLGAEAEGGM